MFRAKLCTYLNVCTCAINFMMAVEEFLSVISRKKELGLVADPVIEAIARLEFEDGLRRRVLHGCCWCP